MLWQFETIQRMLLRLSNGAYVRENPLPPQRLLSETAKALTETSELALQQALLSSLCGNPVGTIPETAAALKQLQAGGMEVRSFSSTRLEGTIFCQSDCLLMTTIPNDGGWQVKVDGEAAGIVELLGYLCGVRLEPGEHTLSMEYHAPGYRAGLAITLGSLTVLWFLKRRQVKC